MWPYKNIESVEKIESPISNEMTEALDLWYQMYIDKPSWLSAVGTKSLGLPGFICSEIARQILLEMKWNITAKTTDGSTKDEKGNAIMNPRAAFLNEEFRKCVDKLRDKLEKGCAAGGMIIKPYPKDGIKHIYFDWSMDWEIYPISFDDDGNISDIIFKDSFIDGKIVYTRLERHRFDGNNIVITQRAFKSENEKYIGEEIKLQDVPAWANINPETTVMNTDGQLFGWFKVANANSKDVDSPLGASVYAKATSLIRDADEQYSRLLWEFEGSELAVDVDPTALKNRNDGRGMTMGQHEQRLFRKVDTGKDGLYEVFSPSIRDASLINGLNQILIRIEDACGLSRGTLTDAPEIARTATELNILKQRAYATIADNQAALERCLRDVIRTMDVYATLYGLAPDGDYDVSFEWDDSIITDTAQQFSDRMQMLAKGIIGLAEFRQWYFGETKAQSEIAIQAIADEKRRKYEGLEGLLPNVTP